VTVFLGNHDRLEDGMLIYQLKIQIKQNKLDEFAISLHSFLPKICSQKGCLDFRAYQDIERENMYIVVGEWKTRQAMEKHFQTHDFEVLIGAARVLGETFEMNLAEVSKSGSFELAREQIKSKKRKD
jgi:quinol monooxygenase YgiN